MKWLFLILLLPSPCLAKEFHFTFLVPPNGKFEYVTYAERWETAFERAAESCTRFLSRKGKLDEDRKLEIIDICVNPIETKYE